MCNKKLGFSSSFPNLNRIQTYTVPHLFTFLAKLRLFSNYRFLKTKQVFIKLLKDQMFFFFINLGKGVKNIGIEIVKCFGCGKRRMSTNRLTNRRQRRLKK